MNIPTKGERDDGGDNPVGYFGLAFGAVIMGALIVVFAKAIFFG